RRAYLLNVYIKHLLPASETAPYSNEQVQSWLGWLAALLSRENEEEFLIERLQPSCLPDAQSRWLYRLGGVASVGVTMLLVLKTWDWVGDRIPQGAIGIALPTTSTGWMYRLSSFFPFLIISLFSLGAAVGVAVSNAIVPIETLKWSAANAWHGMI